MHKFNCLKPTSLKTCLVGTEYSALYLISSLVLTLFLIPTELEVVFLVSEATQMITRSPGQCEAGLSWSVEADQCDWEANVTCDGGQRP